MATDDRNKKRFERGLKLEIRERMVVKPQTYKDLLETALRAKKIILELNSLKEAKRKKVTGTCNALPRSSGNFSFQGSGSQ